MNILYLSCHSVLEYDEVKMLNDLGHNVFSPGAYVSPLNPGDQMRPGIPGLEYDPRIVELWDEHEKVYPEVNGKEYLTREIVNHFDVVWIMHMPEWVIKNWSVISDKVVVWRTIGQSIEKQENALAPLRSRLRIVRYSPRERSIPNYIGEDAIIRFYKDPDEFKDWTGKDNKILTISQSMKKRGSACNFDFFDTVTQGLPRALYGPGNEGTCEGAGGKLSFEQLKKEMRDSRLYFYTGTHPASYTLNFMEALMTGMPMVCVGPKHGNSEYIPAHYLYEVHDLITHGENGFVTDDAQESRRVCEALLDSHQLAKDVSIEGRKLAIDLFSKDKIYTQWNDFLNTL